jgi:hypothetical protein
MAGSCLEMAAGGWAIELGFKQVNRLEFENWVRREELHRMEEERELSGSELGSCCAGAERPAPLW